jgi:hypothetical protein
VAERAGTNRLTPPAPHRHAQPRLLPNLRGVAAAYTDIRQCGSCAGVPAQIARSGASHVRPRAAQNDASAGSRPQRRTGDLCVDHLERICAVRRSGLLPGTRRSVRAFWAPPTGNSGIPGRCPVQTCTGSGLVLRRLGTDKVDQIPERDVDVCEV